MPFDIAALCERLGGDRWAESFTEDIGFEELANEQFVMRTLSSADIQKLFPSVTLSDTEHIAYIPTRMCNSLPKINKRGRCFFPSVMRKSAASAHDNLVDLDHILKRHKHGEDKVIGHIKAVSFDPHNTWDGKVYEEVASVGVVGTKQSLLIPTKAIPLYALMALYRRTQDGEDIVTQISSGKRRWKSSMECIAFPDTCGFLYDGQFIHNANAPEDMLKCVEKEKVRDYKGKKLALCLGGIEDTVDFCGIGMTTTPADTDSDVLGLFASTYTQTANVQRAMPIRTIRVGFPQEKREEALEIANEAVERILEEKAAITVIGQSDEADGHRHDILSDGSCSPYEGHTHRIESVIIVTGSNPRYTAKLSDNERYMNDMHTGRSTYFMHNHLVDISLKGKRKSGSTPADETASSGDGDENLASEEIMGLKEKVSALEAKLTGALTAEQVANVKLELQQLRASEEIATAVAEGVQEKIKSGELVPKAEHEQKLTAAQQKAKEDADAELKKQQVALQKQTERLQKITALGVDVDAMEDGQTKSIRENVLAIETDERGDREFERELARHQLKVQLAKKADDDAKKEAEKDTATQQANARKPYLLSGNGTATTGGGTGGGNGQNRLPAHFAGKRR